ncbi:hypothetical protein VE04_04981 [Pseudogymnoascus sp. 24MN13]|nr:hypothetical protein VE04_04981 [Pseudogymnoascus sp. 24MN13]
MLPSVALLSLLAAAPFTVVATPTTPTTPPKDVNPFLGKNYYANSHYSKELDQTKVAFLKKGDLLNAARVTTVQRTGTFVWVSNVAGLSGIDTAIAEARAERPGDSAGEFSSANGGLQRYKTEFVDKFAKAVSSAPDLTFAIVLEPDSLGNVITNQGIPFCATASPFNGEGIAYAISKLQFPNVSLYIDAAHGGWLGWADNLPLAAAEFSKVLKLAQTFKKGATIRGFATDVSNFNPYIANPRANYTEWSPSYDEKNYALSLAPFLQNASVPHHFIIDVGRSGLQNQREEWGDWCNVKAGYGERPTTDTGSDIVDSLVWVKPAGC